MTKTLAPIQNSPIWEMKCRMVYSQPFRKPLPSKLLQLYPTRTLRHFPLGIVQLPNFKTPQEQPPEPSGWVTIREQMDKAASDESLGTVGLAASCEC